MVASDLERSSLTLDEILSAGYVPSAASTEDFARADRRLERWCEISADGDWVIFRERLLRDQLVLADVRARLAQIDRSSEHAEPGWVRDCRNALRALKGDVDADAPAAAVPQALEHPFGPLLAPLVAQALRRLDELSPYGDTQLLTASARADIARDLWTRLADLCGLALYRWLADWRNAAPPSDRSADASPMAALQAWGEFLAYMRTRGFDALFAAYPPQLRLVALLCSQWVDGYAEFITRLARDRDALTCFDTALPGARLAGVRYGLSDPHDGGRSVLLATFDNGRRLVYKPKDLSGDGAVDGFLRLLRAAGFSMPLRIPPFLARDGYGWTGFVDSHECANYGDVGEYYRRGGAWLGVFYLLSASDMHMENVLASGADPVPVDFETILQGLSGKPQSLRAETEAAWRVTASLERSVITVGLLPRYLKSDDQTTVSVGGLEPSTVHTKRIAWDEINSIRMRPRIAEEVHTTSSNLPRLDGSFVTIAGHAAALIAGFRATLDFAATIKPEIAAFVERTATSALPVRRVFRPTRFYDLLLRRLSDHRTMTDSVTWSMQTEFIARLSDWEGEADEHWKLFASERAALTQLTIPAFRLASNGTLVCAAGHPIATLNIGSGAQAALDRVATLSDEVIAGQMRIVEASFAVERQPASASSGPDSRREPGAKAHVVVELDLADAVYRHLRERAFRAEQSAAWLSLEYLEHQDSAQLGPLGYDLYNGACGIAIFLAAFARARGSSEAADLARAALANVKRAVRSANRKKILRSIGTGGGVGVGSVVYGLAAVAQLLDDADTLDAAAAAARLLTEDVIRADALFDIIGGSAGTCLGLLKLRSITGDAALLEQAVLCASHLEARRPADRPIWSSAMFEYVPLTGISHGAAGYGVAFARLFAATGIERYRAIASSCAAFEDAHYDAARRNWPDLRRERDKGKQWWPIQWCYGAAGIGYARLAMAADGGLASEIAERDVRAAAEAALSVTSYSNDTLCCGVAGQADFLLEAGRSLGERALEQAAADRIAAIAERWRLRGDARWDTGNKDYNLGLFRGVAGIGYAALRVEDPRLPQVLVWR